MRHARRLVVLVSCMLSLSVLPVLAQAPPGPPPGDGPGDGAPPPGGGPGGAPPPDGGPGGGPGNGNGPGGGPGPGRSAIPLAGLGADEQARFAQGMAQFVLRFRAQDGLGPVFNDVSCVACHSNPTVGGDSGQRVTHFARRVAGQFDPMTEWGGTLVQARGIGLASTAAGSHDFVRETVPAEATIVARRIAPTLLGLGLVDAVPDRTFLALAAAQGSDPDRVGGRPNRVVDPTTGRVAVGRFGWKAQVASLLQFSGEAYLNELGITSPAFPNESCPQGECSLLDFNPAPGLNDDGSRVRAVADFMTLLAPPPRGGSSPDAEEGEAIFHEIGCASCHVASLTTGPSPVAALDRRTFSPYSDFLLHDMGSLGDGIEQGQAGGREFRTAPLWGAGLPGRFLHDGRADSLEQAILLHDGQARPARDRFAALGTTAIARLLAFLESL